MINNRCNIKKVLQIAGGFIAWVIGSGFATGQEVLHFFSSYGYLSYAVVLINLVGFVVIGYFIMRSGFENRDKENFNHFELFCGKRIGSFYIWLTTITLLFLIPVLVAGAGATLYEYYGMNPYIGSAVMTVLVLVVYLIGFERMIQIISSIGPLIIVFSLLVGVITVFLDFGSFNEIASYEGILTQYHAAPHWLISAFLYLGLNFFPGSTYFSRLGKTAGSSEELKLGAIVGGTVLMLSVMVMNTAIMLNGDAAAGLDIPVLYLAKKISLILGAVFSVVLVLGIFSSCSVMIWSVCSRFAFKKKIYNTISAVLVAVFAYIISLLSFSKLVGTLYPIIGYIGLIFIGCVFLKGFRKKTGST